MTKEKHCKPPLMMGTGPKLAAKLQCMISRAIPNIDGQESPEYQHYPLKLTHVMHIIIQNPSNLMFFKVCL